jgi:hypothetical protein
MPKTDVQTFSERAKLWVEVSNQFIQQEHAVVFCPFCHVGTLTSRVLWRDSISCERLIKCDSCSSFTTVLSKASPKQSDY